MSPDKDPLMTGGEAAELCGLAPATWRYYHRVGIVPPADDPGDLASPPNRRTPRWRRSTVEHFRTHRIGRGKRTRVREANGGA